jgi:putative membrane protein
MSKKEMLKKVTGTKHLKSSFKKREQIILRDYLALERTSLANERTLFSYLRSGIYMVIAGFAFLQLKQFMNLEWLSYILFFFSLILFILGITRFIILKRKLEVYYNNMENENEESKKDKILESK